MLDVAMGHHLAAFTHLLGNFTSVTATSSIVYPTAKIIAADGSVVKELPNLAPDHISFTGVLDSGVLVNQVWRGGLKTTPGRLNFIWEIDGEEGSIRLTGDLPNSAFIHIVDPKLYLNGDLVAVEPSGLLGMLAENWEEFSKGKEGNYVTIDDAVRIHEVLDAITASSKSGEKVEL